MPTFGRTASGTWHVVGPDGCRYGRAFGEDGEAADGDRSPAETVTATDIVAYQSPDEVLEDRPGETPVAVDDSVGRDGVDEQRLVLPRAVRESDADLCRSCRSTLETHQRRRAEVISSLKRATPVRDVDWDRLPFEDPRQCFWCRAHERTLWENEALDARVCPACGRLYESPLGDPGRDDRPDGDRRPDTPASAVTPVVLGVDLPEYDPTDLVGSNRPVIECRTKARYATVHCDLDRVGHAFTSAAIDAFERIRASYAEWVADRPDHRADVALRVGDAARSVTFEGLDPDDLQRLVAECRPIASDPACWFRIGWPRHGDDARGSFDDGIPGSDPVARAFPQFRSSRRSDSASVDVAHLESITEPGRYERGREYSRDGRVVEIECVDDRVRATVRGSDRYDVRVRLADGQFVDGGCSCPDDALPCKHVVAVVLASGDVEPIGEDRSLENVLAEASAGELRSLLASIAEGDWEVRRRIYEELGE